MATEFDSSYTNYQLNRSPIRKVVRKAYLKRAASLVHGPTLDFGCGVGELLKILPSGSRGLEYNLATVEYCRNIGLAVDDYDGFADDWGLSTLPASLQFESMVISHVLEHLRDPLDILKKLLVASASRGVTRVLVIVPGLAGFKIDPTHLTYVDEQMLSDTSITELTGFMRVSTGYFPGNLRSIGDFFPYHELQVVFDKVADA